MSEKHNEEYMDARDIPFTSEQIDLILAGQRSLVASFKLKAESSSMNEADISTAIQQLESNMVIIERLSHQLRKAKADLTIKQVQQA